MYIFLETRFHSSDLGIPNLARAVVADMALISQYRNCRDLVTVSQVGIRSLNLIVRWPLEHRFLFGWSYCIGKAMGKANHISVTVANANWCLECRR
jgi:hypothetical protein